MAQSYKKHFLELPSNDDGNKNNISFSKASSGEIAIKDRIKNATGDPDNVIICVDVKGKIQLIHSLSNLGGTIRRPEDKIVGAIGMGHDPVGIIVVKSSLGVSCKHKAPGLERYESCESMDDMKKLVASNNEKFNGSNYFCLPPLHLKP